MLLMAGILNIMVFYMIQHLVTSEQGVRKEIERINLTDFIRLDQKPEQPEQEKPEENPREPPPPEESPPPPEIAQPDVNKPAPVETQMKLPNLDIPLSVSGTPYLGDFLKSAEPVPAARPERPAIDSNVEPTFRVPPVYPPRALRMGIEGVVTVEFTITADGSVKDPVIVEANPVNIFDRAVLQAILKWKFNPDVIDGKAVEKRARQDVRFKLQK